MRRNKQLTHAGAVGTAQGGVLLAGKSGAGKSTTALICMEQGLDYVSEDYCLIENDPEPYVYSVYNSAKLEPNTLDLFPKLRNKTDNPDRQPNEKAFLFHQQIFPQKLIRGFPLLAVLVLQIKQQTHTCLHSASIIDGLLALAPSTFFQLSHCQQPTLKMFKELLMMVPCYHLELGHDMQQVAAVIQGVIHSQLAARLTTKEVL